MRLIFTPSMLMFDIAQPPDPSLPRIYRQALACDSEHLNNKVAHPPITRC